MWFPWASLVICVKGCLEEPLARPLASSLVHARTQGLCPRRGTWMDRHTQDIDMAGYMDWPSTVPTCRTHIKHKPRQPCPHLLMGWQRQKVAVQARTWHSQVHRHMHIWGCAKYQHSASAHPPPLSESQAPLALPWVPSTHQLVLAGKHEHTHPTGPPSTDLPPTWHHCLDPERPTHQLVQLVVCWWVTRAHPAHVHCVWGTEVFMFACAS